MVGGVDEGPVQETTPLAKMREGIDAVFAESVPLAKATEHVRVVAWTLAAEFVNMDDGEVGAFEVTSENLPFHRRLGLLHQALLWDGEDDDDE